MTGAPGSRGAQAYYQTHVQSRSPLELVVMLYDGAIRFLREAEAAMLAKDLATKGRSLSRALAILTELQNNLNFEQGGELADRLDSLYTYMIGRLVDANIKGDPAGIQECLVLLDNLRGAWAEIAARPSVAA